MPEKTTIDAARKAERAGRKPSTVAGTFVREELEHVREGKHGARSPKQAIAIGLSKARRAGVKLPVPARGKASPATRQKAARDLERAKEPARPSGARSRGAARALAREPRSTVTPAALSRQAAGAARKRTAAQRSASARQAAATKGAAARSASARKGAKTRAKAAK